MKVLLNWARENKNSVEFAFRPHPLMFNHLLKSGRLTNDQLANIRAEFARSSNAIIDESDDYHYTFLGADCLIADPSTSMAMEFLVQDKPVVYTDGEENKGNPSVAKLTSCYYAAYSEAELIKQLNFLLRRAEDRTIRRCRRKMVESLMAPLKEKSCGARAIEAIVSDVLSK